MSNQHKATGWTPNDPSQAFAGFVSAGTDETRHLGRKPRKREPLEADEAIKGILAGNRTLLARAITLTESKAPKHRTIASEILRRCLPKSGGAVRIGITGVPGAGKSTFIEAFGKLLCDHGKKVAVLTIDPSSGITGGSVLGDKTRMEELSREPGAFIRPSPASGALGGVAARTRETMLLCEAAGFDVIIVETVGVGQSETVVRNMVDFFLLLQIAGAGDELQGIKKGVIEMADAIAVNKADGDNLTKAQSARGEYSRILQYLTPFTPEWEPVATICSALNGDGIVDIWELIQRFHSELSADGRLAKQRQAQNLHWFRELLKEAVLAQFRDRESVKADLPCVEAQVSAGELPVVEAVERILGKS